MPATNSYDYAIVRFIPRVERGECINIGVILFCPTRRFLDMLTSLDETRLRALSPALDFASLQQQLEHLVSVCRGGPHTGPIGQLSQSERFHWLVAPRNTMIQFSSVHCGLCSDPEAALHALLQKLVH